MSRIASLHEIAVLLGGELDRRRLYTGLARGSARLSGATATIVYSCDAAGEHVTAEARVGPERPIPDCVGQALSERRTVAGTHQLATPLLTQGGVGGVLWAEGSFDADQVSLLETLSAMVASALGYAESIASAERREAQAEALLVAYRGVIESRDRDLIIGRTLDTLTTVLGADRAGFYLIDRSQTMSFAAGRRISRQYLEAAATNLTKGVGGTAIAARVPIHVADAATDPRTRPMHAVVAAEGFHTLFIAPLLHRDELLGGLVLYHDIVVPYSPEDIAMVRGFAAQVAIALTTAALIRRLEGRLVSARVLAAAGRAAREADNDVERLQRAAQAIVAGGLTTQAWIFHPDGTLAAQAGMSGHSREAATAAARPGLGLDGDLAAAPITFRGETFGTLILAGPPRPSPSPARPQTVTIQFSNQDDPDERLELALEAAEHVAAAVIGARRAPAPSRARAR
jgi:GAF domain-containing protein